MRRFRIIAVFSFVMLFLGAHVAYADTLGQNVTFNVNPSYDAAGASVISATLRSLGANAYFYVDDRTWAALSPSQQNAYQSQLDALSGQFDSVIWPRETAFWGMPASPGVDNDPRITVLLQKLSTGSGGYFDTINGYPKSRAPDSNAREMVVVAADSVLNNAARDFLAHEFQHLISFNQKELLLNVSEDTWLNEARSEYSIALAGYDVPFAGSTLQRRIQTFLRTPNDSLTEWPNTSTDYGVASVFIHYLADRFGPGILQYTLHSRSSGTAAIQDWLSANQPGKTFGSVFADWMVDVTTNPQILYTVPQSQLFSTLSWSPTAIEWQPEWFSFQRSTNTPTDTSIMLNTTGSDPWFADIVADYGTSKRMLQWSSSDGPSVVIPALNNGSALQSATLMLAQGSIVPVGTRQLSTEQATVLVSTSAIATIATPTPSPTPSPVSSAPKDGDLIERAGQADVYVIWGPYRRYMTPGTLALYGFQSRQIMPVSDAVFFHYLSTNYIRAIDQQKVYAVWPDGTKHWLRITPAQWDASGRDWNAIFIVNDAEVNYYKTGVDITR